MSGGSDGAIVPDRPWIRNAATSHV